MGNIIFADVQLFAESLKRDLLGIVSRAVIHDILKGTQLARVGAVELHRSEKLAEKCKHVAASHLLGVLLSPFDLIAGLEDTVQKHIELRRHLFRRNMRRTGHVGLKKMNKQLTSYNHSYVISDKIL